MHPETTQPFIARLDAAMARQLVDYRGQQVMWRSLGTGTPLVLLHGGHGSWLHWVRNIEALAASHRVLVPDMPGFGESGAVARDTPLADVVDILAHTLDQLIGAGTIICLAGFSFGAIAAAQLAQTRGGVSKLALLGPGGHGQRRRQSEPLLNWRLAREPGAMLAALRKNLSITMLHGEVDALGLEVHRYSCVHTSYRSKATARTAILPALLARLHMPALLLWGEHDATGVPAELGPMLADGRPEREWESITGAGHWVQYERAVEVNRRLLAWFAGPR